MRSTFMGLETAKRGMFAQQSALHTTGNNIANANTEGYTRQRVNFKSTEAYPSLGLNRPQLPGQLGTGVEAESVQRVRESFLDIQYRSENNKLGYWESRANALQKMEEIMNEPSETGLANSLDQFWQSLQDLALDPTNAGARSVVRQRGNAVADTFNYLATSLKSVQGDLKNELDVSVKEINSLASQLNNINKQISEIEPNGYLPNDLYDERDRLLDKLSSLANIKVTYNPSGGNALKIAEGTATVDLVDDNGKVIGTLVDAKSQKINELSVNYNKITDANGNITDGLVESVRLGSKTVDIMDFNSAGKLSGLIDSYGYTETLNDGSVVEYGLYPQMLNDLDTMAYVFADQFNSVHQAGWNLNDFNSNKEPVAEADKVGVDFFNIGTTVKGAASTISISDMIKESTDYIAAGSKVNGNLPEIGNGGNATLLSNVKNDILTIGGTNTTLQNFYEGVIGGMAVNAQEAERLTTNSNVLRDSVEQRRQSVSAVSLDEEMTNMIQFQHAYNAAARMITMQDEILDKIINGMGISGR
ncbi:flagellar hook-associated protein FlgK [Metabacillus halosaccharovorans]|uniref:Flagellar hook-associated protein 1 n=1 Tax=Metabacillus halosaccharovorans TaxID=930124 RepID=A0ABT3DCA6_9BACI|nr:flagellar hook-associated protein FlgK [Metabacillus halosaccharovorans]MCV9884680.1 flagellar hook-associated protein FlgK [Metabacillus halosaccharovorans]